MKKRILLTAVVASLTVVWFNANATVPVNEKFSAEAAQLATTNPKELIFIHGMFMTPRCWDGWTERFTKAGYQVSAPAWPLHDQALEEQRKSENFPQLTNLTLEEVVESYRTLLRDKNPKPIIIGHSMGGLVAQILLSEGFAQAAIAIDSAPPRGVFTTRFAFLKSNWGSINPFADINKPLEMNLKSFSANFANQQPPEEQARLYNEQYVPESRRVGKGPLSRSAKIDKKKLRGPLLLIAGGADNIIPDSLNYNNFKFYSANPSYTEFQVFSGRDHSTIMSAGWEDVAQFAETWLDERFQK